MGRYTQRVIKRCGSKKSFFNMFGTFMMRFSTGKTMIPNFKIYDLRSSKSAQLTQNVVFFGREKRFWKFPNPQNLRF